MSTAADILGLNRKTGVPARWAAHYQQLCAERDRLMARDFSTSKTTAVKMADLTDAAAEEAERNMLLVGSSATQGTLVEVLEAIRRIERGAYGVCEVTGQPIESKRLKAMPWVRCSLAGQAEVERGRAEPKLAIPS